MPNEVLKKEGTQIIFYASGTFSPADAGTNWKTGTPSEVDLTLASISDSGGRQSDKVDLGATRPAAYEVLGCVDYTGELPTEGQSVDYYWASSVSATAGTGNVAGNSGVDGNAPDGAVGGIDLDSFLLQCDYIGSLVVHSGDGASGGVQTGKVGVFSPSSRYGQLIVVNNGGDQFEGDDVEMHQVFNPIIDEIQ